MTKDLVALVADNDMHLGLKAILSRRESLRIREVRFDIRTHPEHDPGCRLKSAEFLRSFQAQYAFAIVLFDREGCGATGSRAALETEVESQLSRNGWGNRSTAIVIDPELEAWVWSDSPNLKQVLGWKADDPTPLPDWLDQVGFPISGDCQKPSRPKEALLAALRKAGKARSASLYAQVAQSVGLDRCTDPAFLKLKTTLQGWFGLPTAKAD